MRVLLLLLLPMTASFVIFQPKAFVSSLESSIEDTPVEPPSVVPEVSTPAGPPKITMRKKKEVVPVAVTETATEEVVVVTKTSSKREYEILTRYVLQFDFNSFKSTLLFSS